MFQKDIQLCVFLRNQVGKLAEVCDLLGSRGVNIRALNVSPGPDFGVMRMVVDEAGRAEAALEEQGLPFLEVEVLTAELPNRPGMAARLGKKLSEAGVNIEYTFFSGGAPETNALLVFMVSDIEKALECLKDCSLE